MGNAKRWLRDACEGNRNQERSQSKSECATHLEEVDDPAKFEGEWHISSSNVAVDLLRSLH